MKKKASLNKKLLLGKTIVANLSPDQQQQLAGGAVSTRTICVSRLESCATIPPGGRVCMLCP